MRLTRVILLNALTAVTVIAAAPAPVQASAPVPGTLTRITILDGNGREVALSGAWISPDGESLLFQTNAPLAPGDTNNLHDLYLQDRATGKVEWITVTSTGGAPNGQGIWPDMSFDARYVVFQSTASNFVPGDTNGVADVFVRDRVARTTTLVSAATNGAPGDRASTDASISNDGGEVAFLSSATNLIADDTNQYADIFVRDLAAGKTERVSVMSGGTQGVFNPENPEISGNGRFVIFAAAFPYEADDTNAPSRDVYVHDRVTRETDRASVASDGSEGPLASFYPTISDDGRTAVFSGFNPNYVPNDTNGYSETFAHDMQTGRTDRIVGPDGQQGDGVVGVPVISSDARFVTANFLPSNYGYEDANGSTDVYRVDRLTGHVDLASATPEGAAGNAISYSPSMSADGRFITFVSEATNLLPGGNDAGYFLRDLGPPLGVGSVTAAAGGSGVDIAGWARLSAGPFVSAADPDSDAGPAAKNAGAELTGARLIYRPERGDLQLRVDLAPRRHVWPPLVGTDAQKPGAMTYGFRFQIAENAYEARAVAGANGPSFSLHRCGATCVKTADLRGGIGTASEDVRISIPLADVGAAEGTSLEGYAFVAPGEGTTGPLATLDRVALSQAEIPVSSIDLGIAERGTPRSRVAFDVRGSLQGGAFSGTLASPGNGKYDAWARVCLGDLCSASSAPVEI